ncbi:MAG: hypothetical protein KTR14_01975 [Vampirovibrio sp.]|nr:hypothetical protein [Vampirovibrio sp.]
MFGINGNPFQGASPLNQQFGPGPGTGMPDVLVQDGVTSYPQQDMLYDMDAGLLAPLYDEMAGFGTDWYGGAEMVWGPEEVVFIDDGTGYGFGNLAPGEWQWMEDQGVPGYPYPQYPAPVNPGMNEAQIRDEIRAAVRDVYGALDARRGHSHGGDDDGGFLDSVFSSENLPLLLMGGLALGKKYKEWKKEQTEGADDVDTTTTDTTTTSSADTESTVLSNADLVKKVEAQLNAMGLGDLAWKNNELEHAVSRIRSDVEASGTALDTTNVDAQLSNMTQKMLAHKLSTKTREALTEKTLAALVAARPSLMADEAKTAALKEYLSTHFYGDNETGARNMTIMLGKLPTDNDLSKWAEDNDFVNTLLEAAGTSGSVTSPAATSGSVEVSPIANRMAKLLQDSGLADALGVDQKTLAAGIDATMLSDKYKNLDSAGAVALSGEKIQQLTREFILDQYPDALKNIYVDKVVDDLKTDYPALNDEAETALKAYLLEQGLDEERMFNVLTGADDDLFGIDTWASGLVARAKDSDFPEALRIVFGDKAVLKEMTVEKLMNDTGIDKGELVSLIESKGYNLAAYRTLLGDADAWDALVDEAKKKDLASKPSAAISPPSPSASTTTDVAELEQAFKEKLKAFVGIELDDAMVRQLLTETVTSTGHASVEDFIHKESTASYIVDSLVIDGVRMMEGKLLAEIKSGLQAKGADITKLNEAGVKNKIRHFVESRAKFGEDLIKGYENDAHRTTYVADIVNELTQDDRFAKRVGLSIAIASVDDKDVRKTALNKVVAQLLENGDIQPDQVDEVTAALGKYFDEEGYEGIYYKRIASDDKVLVKAVKAAQGFLKAEALVASVKDMLGQWQLASLAEDTGRLKRAVAAARKRVGDDGDTAAVLKEAVLSYYPTDLSAALAEKTVQAVLTRAPELADDPAAVEKLRTFLAEGYDIHSADGPGNMASALDKLAADPDLTTWVAGLDQADIDSILEAAGAKGGSAVPVAISFGDAMNLV